MSDNIRLEVASEDPKNTNTTSVTVSQYDIKNVKDDGDSMIVETSKGSHRVYMEDQPVETENAIAQFRDCI